MLNLQGRYTCCRIMIDSVAPEAMRQLYAIINARLSENTIVAIMPDCHQGKGCVVGFTQKLNSADPRLCPNLLGVDIGCALTSIRLGPADCDPAELDRFIRANIPLGAGGYLPERDRKLEDKLISKDDYALFAAAEAMIAEDGTEPKVALLSQLKSVGSGNHFIEAGRDSAGEIWLTVHSGSRNFGLVVCNIYQRKAVETCNDRCEKDLKYLDRSSRYFERYLLGVKACQRFSRINHAMILQTIADGFFGRKALETVSTMHNYIDLNEGIVRKGAIRARAGEKLLLPFNMRDGIALCAGRGNEDWNFSAPHGSGRILSRGEAKELLDVEAVKKEMADHRVFTTSLDYAIDEAAGAYKSKELILGCVEPAVEVNDLIRPFYNIKGR